MKIKISKSYDDQFIVIAAFRYCLSRHSYAPGLFVRWLEKHWKQLDDRNRHLSLKEIGEALDRREVDDPQMWVMFADKRKE